MSYTIEYNRQFILSDSGITPVWLSGSNNVTEYRSRIERRCREWTVFCGLLGTTEQILLDTVEPWMGGCNEHWKRGSKWITDDGLRRWIHSGCASAASVEDIIAMNRLYSIECKLSVWGKGLDHEFRLNTSVRTTQEFDKWIALAKEEITGLSSKGMSVFPIVDFREENLRHPQHLKSEEEGYLVKLRHGYLSGKPKISEYGVSYDCTADIRKAHVFMRDEAMAAVNSRLGSSENARAISAARKNAPYNVVIQFNTGRYFVKRSRTRIWTTSSISSAKIFPNRSTANAACKQLSIALSNIGWDAKIICLKASEK